MKANKTPKILSTGSYGYYIVMSPNFETAKLEETEERIHMAQTVQFGLQEYIESPTPSFIHKENDWGNLPEDQVHKKSFKEFIELLQNLVIEKDADYALLSIKIDCKDCTHWTIEGQYQLLVAKKNKLSTALRRWTKKTSSI